MRYRIACSILGLIISSSGFAIDDQSSTTNRFTDSSNALDKEAALHMTEIEQALAKQWMLKEADWLKYKTIMSGPRGIWSPGLDPLTALGVSETDPQERSRYAEIWMKMEMRRVELELAFEVERQKAGKKLTGDMLAVNNQGWIKQWEEDQKAIQYQVMFFVDATCTDDCKPAFNKLFKSIGNNTTLDIYFKDGIGSEAIGVWASFMGIDPNLVRSKKVTLNFDAGRAKTMEIPEDSFPVVKVLNIKTGEISDTYND